MAKTDPPRVPPGGGQRASKSDSVRSQKVVGPRDSVSKGHKQGIEGGAKPNAAPPSKPPMQALPPTSKKPSRGKAQGS